MEWKLEINNRKITGKPPNIRRLNNTLLNNTWVKEEISKVIQNYFELNENKNTTFQNLWHVGESVLKEKHIALTVILEKKDLKSII